MQNNNSNTAKKLTAGIVTIIVLAICLCITTFALIYAAVSVNDNTFQTGGVKINLNDGKPVIQEDEFLFEPGMTVEKDFFIKNESTWEVYYRLYFDDVTGGLADVLEITIKEKTSGKTLYEGTAKELSRANVSAADDLLAIDERRDFTVYFHYPEEAGNDSQDNSLTFTICAEATQTKNNPEKQFS